MIFVKKCKMSINYIGFKNLNLHSVSFLIVISSHSNIILIFIYQVFSRNEDLPNLTQVIVN